MRRWGVVFLLVGAATVLWLARRAYRGYPVEAR